MKRKTQFEGDTKRLMVSLWQLDLEPIMVKLMDREEGEGWSLDQTLAQVEEYRRFLYLTVTSPDVIVPTKLIDKVWHAHILDTIKYREDCEHLFDFFIDHFPYFGMRGAEDAKDLESAFAKTKECYQSVFGEPMHKNASKCGCGSGGCNAGECKTSRCKGNDDDVRPTCFKSTCDHIRPRLQTPLH